MVTFLRELISFSNLRVFFSKSSRLSPAYREIGVNEDISSIRDVCVGGGNGWLHDLRHFEKELSKVDSARRDLN